MREIKFRAWRNGEMSRPFVLGEGVCWPNGAVSTANRIGHVMQYTGLKDKNGVEIYEGDIVSAHYFYFDGNHDADGEFIGEIEFSSWGTFLITRPLRKNKCEIMHFIDTSHFEEPCIEVLGNKYENPELIKSPA